MPSPNSGSRKTESFFMQIKPQGNGNPKVQQLAREPAAARKSFSVKEQQQQAPSHPVSSYTTLNSARKKPEEPAASKLKTLDFQPDQLIRTILESRGSSSAKHSRPSKEKYKLARSNDTADHKGATTVCILDELNRSREKKKGGFPDLISSSANLLASHRMQKIFESNRLPTSSPSSTSFYQRHRDQQPARPIN